MENESSKYEPLLNRRDSERSWLNKLVSQVTNAQQQKKIQSNAARMAEHASFVCEACSKPFTTAKAIDEVQGICDECGNSLVHVATKEHGSKKPFECTRCGKVRPKEECRKSKCECGCRAFVSQQLMQKVCDNTKTSMESHGITVEDIWHEKGNIFASVQGSLPNGASWKTVVAASGKFTDNDVVAFRWKEDGGEGVVVTASPEGLKKNASCTVEWCTDDDYVAPESVKLADASGKPFGVGNKLTWYTASGKREGMVLEATNDKKLIVGITRDEYGKCARGVYAAKIELTQDEVNKLSVFVD